MGGNVGLADMRRMPAPAEVEHWLRTVTATQAEDTEDYPPGVRKRLLYVLNRSRSHPGPELSLQTIELRKDGTPSGVPSVFRHQPHANQQPRFLRPSDRAILRAMAINGATNSAINGAAEGFPDLLRAVIATGRGRWGAWDGPALHDGPTIPGRIAWIMLDDGAQRPRIELDPPLEPLLITGAWYADPGTGAVGRADTGLPDRMVRAMLMAPPLSPEAAGQVAAELPRRAPALPVPPPAVLPPPMEVREQLQPRLRLLAAVLPADAGSTYARANLAALGRQAMQGGAAPAAKREPLARLSWQYGPAVLSAESRRDVVVGDGRLFRVVRDPVGETEAALRLRRLGFSRVGHRWYLPFDHPNAADLALLDPDPDAWVDFVLHEVPALREDGWIIEADPDFPVRIAQATGDVLVRIEEGSGIDWFDLDLGVMVDGERISLVPAMLDLIGSAGAAMVLGRLAQSGPADDDDEAPLLLPLPDGRLLAVPFGKLRPILGPLMELLAGAERGPEGTLRLSRRNAADLALLEAAGRDAGLAWSGGDAVRALGRGLREHGGIPPVALPAGFRADLRPYQAAGLAWLQFLGAAGLGGILADDMGLGKTVQALAHLAVDHAAGRLDRPALVVCPTSLAPNWQAEAARFAPMLRTLVLHGPDRAARFPDIAAHDLVVTTYPLLARDHKALQGQEWHAVLLDEAQTIKNPLAATSRLARTLRARQRLCLSGTPLENHLGELWSLFDFLMPGFLGDQKAFVRNYRTPIEKGGDTGRAETLRRRIAPFLLRRTKEEVAADLPAKTEITEQVAMADAQRAVYEGIRLTMHAKVRAAVEKRGVAGSGIIILDAMLKLRQACCDPRLLRLETAKAAKAGSAKLDRLLELLPQMVEDGRRVLLFSQFTSMLALIEAELAKLRLPYALLTGDTADRRTPVRRFQAGEVPLFLVSLKAGGTGLNLTAADTVIHYDPWWNPAVEDQATDRAHRIGQDKPVFVHRLITQGTIEEKMEALKARKQALSDTILGAGPGATLGLTEADLDALFAPVGG